MNTTTADPLSITFAALADPTRRAIIGRLAEDGEATVTELAEPFPVSVQAISKHLQVLERAGLITRARTAQLRPSRLEGAPLKLAADWLARVPQVLGGGLRPARGAPDERDEEARERLRPTRRASRSRASSTRRASSCGASGPSPSAFADWYGGARRPRCPSRPSTMDVSEGGAWRATMFAGPGRREIHWEGEYREVDRARAARVHGHRPARGGASTTLVTVVLADLDDGRTGMDFQQRGGR